MADFNKGGRFSDRGGKRGGNNSRGGFSDGGRSNRGRQDSGRSSMHPAVCGDCGNDCEVPFRPTGERPIFCSSCFSNQQERGGNSRSYSRNDSQDRSPRNRGSRDRNSQHSDKQMFKAVCAECDSDCEVPFRPTGDKPIYCSECFSNQGNSKQSSGNSNEVMTEIKSLHAKIDELISLLVTGFPEEEEKEEESDDEGKADEEEVDEEDADEDVVDEVIIK